MLGALRQPYRHDRFVNAVSWRVTRAAISAKRTRVDFSLIYPYQAYESMIASIVRSLGHGMYPLPAR